MSESSVDGDAGETASYWKEQGNSFYAKLKLSVALNCYSKAVSLDPKNPVYLGNRSAVHFSVGWYDHCIDDLLSALSLLEGSVANSGDISISNSSSGGGSISSGDAATTAANKSLSNKLKTRLTTCAIIANKLEILDAITLGEDQTLIISISRDNKRAALNAHGAFAPPYQPTSISAISTTSSSTLSASSLPSSTPFLCSKIKCLRLPVVQTAIPEYYFSGHDQATSAFEELHEYLCKNGSPYPIDIKTLKEGTALDVCYFGVGDGRHFFKSLAHIFDEIDAKAKAELQHNITCKKKKKRDKFRDKDIEKDNKATGESHLSAMPRYKIDQKFRFTLNDIHPASIARLIILFLQLNPLINSDPAIATSSSSTSSAAPSELNDTLIRAAFLKDAVAITQCYCSSFVYYTVYDEVMQLVEQCAKSSEFYLSRLPFIRMTNKSCIDQVQAAFQRWSLHVPLQTTRQTLKNYSVSSTHPLLKMQLMNEAMKDQGIREDFEKRQKQEKVYMKALVTSIPDSIISVLMSEPGISSMKDKRIALINKIQTHFDHDLNVLELLHSPSHVILQSIFLYECKLLPLPYDYPLLPNKSSNDSNSSSSSISSSSSSSSNEIKDIVPNDNKSKQKGGKDNNGGGKLSPVAASGPAATSTYSPSPSTTSTFTLLSGIRHLYGHADLDKGNDKTCKTLKEICEAHISSYRINPLCMVFNNFEHNSFNPLECMTSIKDKVNPNTNLDRQMEKMMKKEDIYGIFLGFFYKAAQVLKHNDITVELNVSEMNAFAFEIAESKDQRYDQGFATEYNRIWMSNIPDYTGILLPLLSVEGILKRDKDMIDVDEEMPRSHTSSCNLFNCNLWKDYNHYIYSSSSLADVDQLKRLLGLEAVNSDLRDYQNWAPVLAEESRSYADVYGYKQWDISLKDEIKDWLQHFLLSCCCPCRRHFDTSIERNSANMHQFFLAIDFLSGKGVPGHWLSGVLSDLLTLETVAALPPMSSPNSREIQAAAEKRKSNSTNLNPYKAELKALAALWTAKPSFPLLYSIRLPSDVRRFSVKGLMPIQIDERLGVTMSLGLVIRAVSNNKPEAEASIEMVKLLLSKDNTSIRDQAMSGSKDIHIFSALDYVYTDAVGGDESSSSSRSRSRSSSSSGRSQGDTGNGTDDSLLYLFMASNAFIDDICRNSTKLYTIELYRLDYWDRVSVSVIASPDTVKVFSGVSEDIDLEHKLKRVTRLDDPVPKPLPPGYKQKSKEKASSSNGRNSGKASTGGGEGSPSNRAAGLASWHDDDFNSFLVKALSSGKL